MTGRAVLRDAALKQTLQNQVWLASLCQMQCIAFLLPARANLQCQVASIKVECLCHPLQNTSYDLFGCVMVRVVAAPGQQRFTR